MLFTAQGCARLCTGLIIIADPSVLIRKKSLLCRKARYVRSLVKKPHIWPSQRLKKVLFPAQGCARLRTGPIIMQIPRGYHKKKVYCVQSLAFPEAKKGVVHCARLRKAAHWPNNNANPSGLSEKKVYCVEKRDMCDP